MTMELIKKIESSVDQFKVDNEAAIKAMNATLTATGDEAKAAIKVAEDLAKKVEDQACSIVEMQQKLTDNVVRGKAPVQTLATIVTASPEFKAFATGGQSFRIQAAITGQDGSPPENSSTLVQADRRAFVDGAYRALRLRDIMQSSTTSSNMIEYPRELVATLNAKETAEGETIPESAITYQMVSSPVATIPHLIYASEQALADSPFLEAHINRRLVYGVALRYENQILNGTGLGQNISGILAAGNHTVFTPEAGENALDSANRAIEKVSLADYQATGFIMNTSDWHRIERLKVGSGDDRYIIGDPAGTIITRLWGKPVVVTNQIAANTFICAAFDVANEIVDRAGITVEMSREHKFDKMVVAIRAYARGTVAHMRPASCFAGNLVTVGT